MLVKGAFSMQKRLKQGASAKKKQVQGTLLTPNEYKLKEQITSKKLLEIAT